MQIQDSLYLGIQRQYHTKGIIFHIFELFQLYPKCIGRDQYALCRSNGTCGLVYYIHHVTQTGYTFVRVQSTQCDSLCKIYQIMVIIQL